MRSNRAIQRTVTSGFRPLVPAADGDRSALGRPIATMKAKVDLHDPRVEYLSALFQERAEIERSLAMRRLQRGHKIGSRTVALKLRH